MKFRFTIILFVIAAIGLYVARLETMVPRTALNIYHNYIDLTEAEAIPGLTAETALEIQKNVVYSLSENWSGVAGYKAALTNPAIQKKLNVEEPLLGFMLKKMLLQSPATINIKRAVHPFAEADLMVRVADSSINTAQTDAEFMAALDQVIPFIEIPDLLFSKERPLSADMLTAINTGARYGVMGQAIDINHIRNLKDCQVGIVYDDKSHFKTGSCSTLMGDPIIVIRWIRDKLLSMNLTLKKGNLLSLGSLTAPVPLKKGRLTAIYSQLGDKPYVSVSVDFK